jgi:hypothetical protein
MTRQPPQVGRLDDYVSAFYEDALEAKIKSSKDIL